MPLVFWKAFDFFFGGVMSKPNAVLTMGRNVDQFIAPDQMERLKSLVTITIPD